MKGGFMEHPNQRVRKALIELSDALCSWERATSRDSVLILREDYGFEYRAVSGKPQYDPEITDEMLFNILKWKVEK